jgi:hypothetical protein
MGKMWRIVSAAIVFVCLAGATLATEVRGRVFLDANGNDRADPGERGIANVLVSDGVTVIATAEDGSYRLPIADARAVIRMTRPPGYAPTGSFWQWSDGSTPADFGLVEEAQSDDFFFVHVTDSHLGRLDLFKEFAQRINRFPIPLAFAINTGDLVGGVDVVAIEAAKAQFDRYIEGAAEFEVPLLNIPGNHEHVAAHLKEADRDHPWYGKGLYREMLGPLYYSWNYGPLHFVALDGTTLWYQERLGEQQLAWLKANLARTPVERPIVLFCHQSLLTIRDGEELFRLFEGRTVLAGFCGHLHRNFIENRGNVPVIHTGALSGSWWSGPNPDGTPQGFRLVHVQGESLRSAYTDRQGHYSLYVSSPDSTEIRSGAMPMEVVLLDFGTADQFKVQARLGETTVDLELAGREPAWSTWRGTLDTASVFDGLAAVEVTAIGAERTDRSTTQYLVVNDRPAPFEAQGPAVLKMVVRNLRADGEISFNGQPLGVIPADTPNETTIELTVPADRLKRLNTVTLRAGIRANNEGDRFGAGPIWMEYQGRRIHDIRYVSFHRHSIGTADPQHDDMEKDLVFALP